MTSTLIQHLTVLPVYFWLPLQSIITPINGWYHLDKHLNPAPASVVSQPEHHCKSTLFVWVSWWGRCLIANPHIYSVRFTQTSLTTVLLAHSPLAAVATAEAAKEHIYKIYFLSMTSNVVTVSEISHMCRRWNSQNHNSTTACCWNYIKMIKAMMSLA